ncbi:MAG: DegT/DnrJ/EryC1/StrS family aminotransferase [Anaeromyxobacter sp.]|nr:DegT/DnrJ/EryC1/StrS family aminotransferase [Anaeromyxobacter sp.]
MSEATQLARGHEDPAPGAGRPQREYLPFGKPNFSDREIEAVARVMRTGWIGMGKETLAFEAELAAYLGAPHVVTVNSCTSALFLAMLASGIRPGDAVIVPSLTWCATANAALYLGATAVFADVDPETLCLTPETVRARLGPRTRAVLPVHYGGLAADIAGIRAAVPAGVAVVEDAAHAFGSRFQGGATVGSSGHLTCFSFYANKNLSTGEGGAIALADPAVADRLRSLRQNALPNNAWNRFTQPRAMLYFALEELGYKMNFTDLNAAIGRVQLARQAEFAATRRGVAGLYLEALRHLDPDIRVQRGLGEAAHARHLFPVVLPVQKLRQDRDTFILALRERNIGASIHYAPLHRMPLYTQGNAAPELPVTDALAASVMTLPISASMTLADAEDVMTAFAEVYRAALRPAAAAPRSAGLRLEAP